LLQGQKCARGGTFGGGYDCGGKGGVGGKRGEQKKTTGRVRNLIGNGKLREKIGGGGSQLIEIGQKGRSTHKTVLKGIVGNDGGIGDDMLLWGERKLETDNGRTRNT